MMYAMTRRLPFASTLILGLCLAWPGAPGDRAFAETIDNPDIPETMATTAETASELPLGDLRTFAEVFGRIKEEYVEGVQDELLLEGAIRGMLAGLDPHSAYLDNEEFQDLQVGTRGEFGGLGIEVGMEDGFVKVIAPIDDTTRTTRRTFTTGDTIVRIRPEAGEGDEPERCSDR